MAVVEVGEGLHTHITHTHSLTHMYVYIPVQHSVLVTKGHAPQQLEEERLQVGGREVSGRGRREGSVRENENKMGRQLAVDGWMEGRREGGELRKEGR